MKKLLKFFRGSKKEAVLAPFFKMLEALLELTVPLVVKELIDSGIPSGESGRIFRLSALLAVIALAGLLLSVTAQFFAAKAATSFSSKLRDELFRHVGTLSYADIDRLGASALITRMTGDVSKVQNGINLTLRLLLRSPFVVFGAMIMAFTVDVPSAVTFAGTIPALSVVVFTVMLVSIPLFKTVQSRLDEVTVATRGALNGVRVIRAFGREEKEAAKFRETNGRLNTAAEKAARISSLTDPVTFVIINLATVILVRTGALRVDAGLLSQGSLVALYNYMAQILTELVKLANLILTITKAAASADRIGAVLDTKPSIVYPENGAAPDENAPAVELKNVSFTYAGAGSPSLSDISFTLNRGERLGIIGATGSGKTTLIDLIPRFYDAAEGEVRLFGHNVKKYTKESLNRLTAVVPQKATLFRGTIRENLLWGAPDADEPTLLAAIRAAQAEDILAAKEDGIDAGIEEGGKNLSGGQRQRLTVARALVKHAPVLILDDASSALDAATDAAMRKALTELPGDPAVILVSQRVSAVRDCDKILVLDDGRTAGFGTHAELTETCAEYREIVSSQTGGDDRG